MTRVGSLPSTSTINFRGIKVINSFIDLIEIPVKFLIVGFIMIIDFITFLFEYMINRIVDFIEHIGNKINFY